MTASTSRSPARAYAAARLDQCWSRCCARDGKSRHQHREERLFDWVQETFKRMATSGNIAPIPSVAVDDVLEARPIPHGTFLFHQKDTNTHRLAR